MSKTKEEKLEELFENVRKAVVEYNLKAKELGDYSRVAYLVADYNGQVQEEIDDGEEIPEDWEPNWDMVYGGSPKAPHAEGWFPSSYC